MKKLILLTLLSFGIYSCDNEINPGDYPSVEECTFDYNNTTVWINNNQLLFPNDLPPTYQTYGNGIFDAFQEGDIWSSTNRAYAVINYHASSLCTGEATKLYRPEDTSYGYFTFDQYPTCEDPWGEYTGVMKSDVWNYNNSTDTYFYIIWTGTPVSEAAHFINFDRGILIGTFQNSNGRQTQQQKLIINDSKNYIYSGGVRTTI